jgi:hypothetical protein
MPKTKKRSQKAGGYTFNFSNINGVPIMGVQCAADIQHCDYKLPPLSGGGKRGPKKRKNSRKSKKKYVAKK